MANDARPKDWADKAADQWLDEAAEEDRKELAALFRTHAEAAGRQGRAITVEIGELFIVPGNEGQSEAGASLGVDQGEVSGGTTACHGLGGRLRTMAKEAEAARADHEAMKEMLINSSLPGNAMGMRQALVRIDTLASGARSLNVQLDEERMVRLQYGKALTEAGFAASPSGVRAMAREIFLSGNALTAIEEAIHGFRGSR